ncbi:MAG: hypothetical protein ABJB74_13280 [Gemmatimonas sp.]
MNIARIVDCYAHATIPNDTMRSHFAGDLVEGYEQRREQRGTGRAIAWLLRQCVISVPYCATLTRSSCREHSSDLRTLKLAVGFYGVFGELTIVGVATALGLARVGALLPSSISIYVVIIAIVAVTAIMFLSGYAAARCARSVPLVGALAVGCISAAVCGGDIALTATQTPRWFLLTIIGFAIPCTTIAALWRSSVHTSSARNPC